MSAAPELHVGHTADLDPDLLRRSRGLLFDVFDDMAEDDWEHCLGGIHAVLLDAGEVVGHASVIQRRLIHDRRALRTGYVEGVAVRDDRRGRGYGGRLMAALERIVRGGYEVGALGATDEALLFYQHRGWQPWRGPLWALSPDGPMRTPDEDGGVLVLAGPAHLDLDADLMCDWRPGDVW